MEQSTEIWGGDCDLELFQANWVVVKPQDGDSFLRSWRGATSESAILRGGDINGVRLQAFDWPFGKMLT